MVYGVRSGAFAVLVCQTLARVRDVDGRLRRGGSALMNEMRARGSDSGKFAHSIFASCAVEFGGARECVCRMVGTV
jgi:hypothetical protein